MTVHVLVWSQDLWVVPNPYTNATSYPPVLPPLGPPDEYRDPLDFCWTTTMRRNEVNYAPFVVILSALGFIFLTIWFPVALHRSIKLSVPKVDKFTELGRLRNNCEMEEEYHHLLDRDQNPFAFLYSGFRRGWGTYESIYLGAKTSTLLIVAVIDSNNCLFRSVSRSALPICIFAPFLDPINNASEWTSRLNYLTTSIVALIAALEIPSSNLFSTYVLYTIYVSTYSLSFYFTIVNLGPIQRLLKLLTDFVALKTYILQNSSPDIRRRRLVRLSLRALEGRIVSWPYNYASSIGSNTGWFGKTKYEVRNSIHLTSCILKIKRRGHLLWNGLQLGSGLDVKLQYTKKILVSREVIGLNDDYDLTEPLARFLELNRSCIAEGLPHIEEVMDNYRRYHRKVNEWKNRVLTYRFLSDVYDHPHDPTFLSKYVSELERDPRVRRLVDNCEVELTLAYRRWLFVSQSETRAWWYLFWVRQPSWSSAFMIA
ncbi:hypothetical protein C0995_011795 [Termitomyces sp. Mi166|nr:hypothetical protein C0995_011795 [Termitomyces sp. Mi166\